MVRLAELSTLLTPFLLRLSRSSLHGTKRSFRSPSEGFFVATYVQLPCPSNPVDIMDHELGVGNPYHGHTGVEIAAREMNRVLLQPHLSGNKFG